jgi:hypothetical protein
MWLIRTTSTPVQMWMMSEKQQQQSFVEKIEYHILDIVDEMYSC